MAQVLNKIYIWCSTLKPLNQLSSKKRVKAFALIGREDSTMREPQGVASLALGYVLHWAFSPPLLNPKFESFIMRTSEEKYISLLTDFGFKRIFGSQPNKDDIKEYEDSLKAYRDIQNSIDTAKEEEFAKGYAEGFVEGFVEGFKQGIAKGEQKIVQAMIQQGCDVDFISKVTGISTDTITAYLERQ